MDALFTYFATPRPYHLNKRAEESLSPHAKIIGTLIAAWALLFFTGALSPRWGETQMEHMGRLLRFLPPVNANFNKKIEQSFRNFQESTKKNWALIGVPPTVLPEEGWTLREAVDFVTEIDKKILDRLKGVHFSGAIYSKNLDEGPTESLLKPFDSQVDKEAKTDSEYFQKLALKCGYAFTYAFEKSYLWNGLHHDEFPISSWLEFSIAQMCAEFLGAKKNETVGLFTGGGSLSIFAALRGYSNWGKEKLKLPAEKGVVLLTKNAHAAFFKAASAYSLNAVLVDVDKEGRMDLSSLKKLLKEHNGTVVTIVGSAPSYAPGTQDSLDKIGKIAIEHRCNFHIDHCLGAFARDIPLLGIEGVTSLSMDIHKFGEAPKGCSFLLMKAIGKEFLSSPFDLSYKEEFLHDYISYAEPDWSGGVYGSRNDAGSEGCVNLLTSFLALMLQGKKGFKKTATLVTTHVKEVATLFRKYPRKLLITYPPESVLVAFRIDPAWGLKKNATYAFLDVLKEEGFKLNALGGDNAHFCITPRSAADPTFLTKLEAALTKSLEKIKTVNDALVEKGEDFPGEARMYGALNAAMAPTLEKGVLSFVINLLLGKKAAEATVKAFFRAQANPYR